MANLALVFDLIGRDQSASRTFNDVGDSAERAGKKGEGFGSSISTGLKLAAGALLGAGLIEGFKGLYNAAAESAKIGALTQAAITSTGGAANVTADQVSKLATAISNKTGVDDEAIQSGANLLLTFTNVKNEAGKGNDIFNQTTSIMTDMAAVLGTDASGSAIQLGKALNDPVKGVSALTKVGVSFTAQQKEQIKTLVESGDTLGAQKVILAELSKEFGGAAEAASTPLDKLKVNLGNIQEAIGGALIPTVSRFSSFAVATLIPAFATVSDGAKQVFDSLFHGDFHGGPFDEDSGFIDVIFNIREGFIQARDAVQTFVSGDTFATWVAVAKDGAAKLWAGLQVLGSFLTGTVIPAFAATAAAVAAVAVFFTEHSTAAKALGVVVAGVAAVVVAAWITQAAVSISSSASSVVAWFTTATASTTSATIQSRSTAQIVVGWLAAAASAIANAAVVVGGWVLMGVQSLLNAARMAAAWVIAMGPVGWVIAAVVGLVALIIANWDTVVSWTQIAWSAVTGAIGAAWEWIKGAASAALGFLVTLFLNFTGPGLIIKHWQSIVDFTRSAWSAVSGAVSGAWSNITSAVSSGIGTAVSFVQGLPGRVVGALGNMGSLLYNSGRNLIQGLINGAGSLLSNIGSFFLDKVPGWIKGPFKSALGIASPSKVFAGYGENVGQGFVNGVAGMQPAIASAMAAMADTSALNGLTGGGIGSVSPISSVAVSGAGSYSGTTGGSAGFDYDRMGAAVARALPASSGPLVAIDNYSEATGSPEALAQALKYQLTTKGR